MAKGSELHKVEGASEPHSDTGAPGRASRTSRRTPSAPAANSVSSARWPQVTFWWVSLGAVPAASDVTVNVFPSR